MIGFFSYSKSSLLSKILFLAVLPMNLPAQTINDGAVARGSFTLHYKTVGAGRPLVLLSGGPGFDVDYLMPLAQELSRSYQCILLEQRGTGRSQPSALTPENINVAAMVEDVEALRDSVKVDRLVVLGHSWGGILGMAYAAAHPDHVESLVLVASGGMDSSFAPVFLDNIVVRATTNERQKMRQIEEALGSASDLQGAYLNFFRLIVPLYFFDRDRGEQFMAAARKESFHPQLAQLIQADLLRNYDVHRQLSHFSRPVLIIHGHQDPMPEGVAFETKATLPNAQLIFLNESGHFPWLEQPDAFYKSLQTFLKTEQ
jgi:proline iminopeptidase